jgi:hypothetical protein
MDHPLRKDTRLLTGRVLEQSAFAMLVVLANIFAFEHRQPLVRLGPVVLTNAETIIVLLITFWLLARLVSSKPLHFPRQLWLPLIIWLALLTLSTIVAPAFHDKALLFMGRIVAGILIGLAVYDLVNTPGRRWMVVLALVSGVVIMAVLGLAEGFGIAPVVAWLDGFKYAPTRVGDLLRISATLSYATITAMVLEMVLPLLLVLVVIARRSSLRLLAGVGVVIVLAAHVLTLSRAGFLSLLVVLVLMAIAGWRRGRPKIMAVSMASALLLIGLSATVLLVNPTARLRLSTETEQAWYQVQYESPETVQANAGQLLSVPVQITNVGQRSWSPDGELSFALSYHLTDNNGSTVTYDGERSPLLADVAPGDTAIVPGLIRAPDVPGQYVVEWDMVQESVTWFSWKLAPTSTSQLVVSPGLPVEGNVISSSLPPTDVRITNPTPGRIELWQAALQMAADYPLLGVGPDNFRWQYGAYANVDKWDTGIHANNLYLEWLADTGIIGLLAFLWLTWRLLKLSLTNLSGPSQRSSWLLSLALVAGLLAWYLHGFFDYFYEFTPTYVLFWIMVGLLASLSSGKRGWNARWI